MHGALYAQGWDHETSEQDAQEMEAYETAILQGLGFADPSTRHLTQRSNGAMNGPERLGPVHVLESLRVAWPFRDGMQAHVRRP